MPSAIAIDFVLLAAIWGSSFLFMRLAVVEFGALPTAAVRVAIAAAFLLPILLWKRQGAVLVRHWKPVFLVGLLNSGIPFACYAFALLYITTGLSAILNATVPLFGAVVAWLWLRDRPNASRALGLVIGFAGVALLASGKASFKPDASGVASGWAVVACLVATLCYGISASFTKRYLGGLPPLVTATGSQIGATLGLTLPALWLWPAQTPGAGAWLALVVVGVLCTGIAYILYFRLIENAGPARALAVTFLVPVFALVYGVLLLGETITPLMIGSGLVIIVGTSLSTGLVSLQALLPRPRP
ncbi:MAG: EamA family transporter [Betaproteobacteria bacterium HGW-Betaproteobacteria-3]|jgi:drug/metabolite transporter (DMT)-like permease|nr:MAG: EamA family transporter [Betaproteobacteria bacterium HGW-Betaproteobacteria-3]